MSLVIQGLGTATPAHAIAQSEAASFAATICDDGVHADRLLPVLYRRSGVRRRHSVLLNGNGALTDHGFYWPWRHSGDRGPTTRDRMVEYAKAALPLALRAATGAIEAAEVGPEEFSHLVTVSCSGFAAPGLDIGLCRELGLSPAVERTHVGFMGCHGALNGLRVARAFAGADPEARILLCAVELCSLHYHYGHEHDKLVANALFADGAAALVGGTGKRGEPDADRRWRAVANGSFLVPASEDAMSWTIGDHGFEMTLAPRVPDLIRRHLRPWLERWLGTQQLAIGGVGCWAVHPGGPRILDAVEQALDLPNGSCDTSRDVLANYGNMSSPTVLFIVERLIESEAPRPCVVLGFGPGLVVEAALFA